MFRSPDDKDSVLVPKLVEKLVIPALIDHLKYGFDVLSSRQHARALTAVQDAITHIDTSSGPGGARAISDVVSCIIQRLTHAASSHPKLMPTLKGNSTRWNDAQILYCRRRMWRAIKLTTHIMQWAATLRTLPATPSDSSYSLLALAVSILTDAVLPFAALSIASAPRVSNTNPAPPGSIEHTLRWVWLQLLVFARGNEAAATASTEANEYIELLRTAGVAGNAMPFGSAEQTAQQTALTALNNKLAAAFKLPKSTPPPPLPPPPPPPQQQPQSNPPRSALPPSAMSIGTGSAAAMAFAAASNAAAAERLKSDLQSSSIVVSNGTKRYKLNG